MIYSQMKYSKLISNIWDVVIGSVQQFKLTDSTQYIQGNLIDVSLVCNFKHVSINIKLNESNRQIFHSIGYGFQGYDDDQQRIYVRNYRSFIFDQFQLLITQINQEKQSGIKSQNLILGQLLYFINQEYDMLHEYNLNKNQEIQPLNKQQQLFNVWRLRSNKKVIENDSSINKIQNIDQDFTLQNKLDLIQQFQSILQQSIFEQQSTNSQLEEAYQKFNNLLQSKNHHKSSQNFVNQFSNKVFLLRTDKFEQWKARKIVEDIDFIVNIFVIQKSQIQYMSQQLEQYHQINNSFVQKLYNYWFEPSYNGHVYLYLQLEYIQTPSVQNLENQNHLQNCNEDDLWEITSQIFIGLLEVQKHNLVHNNIDTRSIHFNSQLQVKICDLIPNVTSTSQYDIILLSQFLENLWKYKQNQHITDLLFNLEVTKHLGLVMNMNPLQQKLQQQGQFYTLIQKLSSKTNQQKIYSTLIEVLKKKPLITCIQLKYHEIQQKILMIITNNLEFQVQQYQPILEINSQNSNFSSQQPPTIIYNNIQYYNILEYPVFYYFQQNLDIPITFFSHNYKFYCFIDINLYQKIQQVKKLSKLIFVDFQINTYSIYLSDSLILEIMIINNYVQIKIIV
ncbi:Protein tyrosine kinase domain-containing protein [Spironucleus salmonicida]|uniref:Protein tyrosine kinase domain-containing protein n=1 Tax=Spironucleus salmonicida TaxID=348837 RepID=V6M2Y7_9EUKA|nr:Protein tyrosine kinase domain-containing protein [Spironucleus salmonicida]|eukprot:EST47629.1 Protein tyrosine kinase domain-containing protein [Spironucleus salmonicida]